ncbi:hypothetical protein MKX03_018979 [Papaver bracteatum]|nr:hypothetical protein MKX03_018979 [Papaver bracteatum]
MQFADHMMGLFLRVFACRSATVHEKAMLAIGSLAYSTGPDFSKYIPEFYKYLEMGLQNFEEYQVCAITVGVVGDICRALEDNILPYCDGIMTQLLKNLSSNQLHQSVKPPIFSWDDVVMKTAIGVLGDLADTLGSNASPLIQQSVSSKDFLNECLSSDDHLIKESAE